MPSKAMAMQSGPVLALTTPPSWKAYIGGWPNSFLHSFSSSSRFWVLEV